MAMAMPNPDPGSDRYDWETEFAQLEPELRDAPAETLPDLLDLLARMLVDRGYDLDSSWREESSVVAEFLAAREVAEQDGRADPGDVADAVQKLLGIYGFLTGERRLP
jgi:hypothetical protein